MRLHALLTSLLAMTVALPLSACSEPPQATQRDAGSHGDGGALFDGAGVGDGQSGDVALDGGAAGEAVWLTFEVDDSANQSFGDGDMKWTGSFSWDSKTNTIKPAASWLPTDGPYPLLYDDGPMSSGGHEKEGATAGDHLFSVAVKFVPTEDTTFEYGTLNEFDNWMWIGTNGQLVVKKDASGVLDAKGLVLPKHGTIDLKIEIDTTKLNDKFKTWTSKTHKFYAKGTMNMWTPVQLLDDGKKGDEAAADGKLTYVQSENLGKHDGLLTAKGEVQFIFVTTTGDAFPDAGQEYKGATEAHKEGVRAWANTGAAGAWVELTVELRVDSKGKFKNTAVLLPASAVVPCEPSCKQGETCSAGKCVKDTPKTCTPACKDGETCTDGTCVKNPLKTCTPACGTTETCVAGKCVAKSCSPACGLDQKCVVDICVDLPAVTQVDPAKGPMAGGTKATITGKGFAGTAKVWFGGKAATDVVVKSATSITCVTPAGSEGAVNVEVEIAGAKVSKASGFSYDAPPKPTALLTAPLTVAVEDGTPVTGLTAIVKVPTVSQTPGPTTGLIVEFGSGPSGSDPTLPAAKWTWVNAKFVNENTTKGEETWSADLGKMALGTYAFTVRVSYAGQLVYGDSNGSEDGVDLKKLGSIQVNKPDTTPTVTGFEPNYVSWAGGTVIILGKNLTATTTVVLKSGHPSFPAVTGTSVTVVPGKGISVQLAPLAAFGMMPALPGTLVVTPNGVPAITPKAPLYVVPVGTPTLDGTPSMSDWKSLFALASAKGEWAGNSVSELFVNYDKDNFYLGFKGSVEAKNAFVVYVDTDYGAATGVKNPADLKDNAGVLDNAIANLLKVLDGKFGAEFAMGTVGMAAQTTGKPADAGSAGWRSLANPADFAWLGGKVVTKAGVGVEASLPIKTLFPKGLPAAGATVAFFIKVVNGDGSVAPKNTAMPDQTTALPGSIDTVTTVHVVQLP